MVVGHQLVFHSRQLYWGDTRTPQRHLGEKKSEQKIDEKVKLVGVKELSLQVHLLYKTRNIAETYENFPAGFLGFLCYRFMLRMRL